MWAVVICHCWPCSISIHLSPRSVNCWCPPFSAGHEAFLFICLPGLSLLSLAGHVAFLCICLPGLSVVVSALFGWPCSISTFVSLLIGHCVRLVSLVSGLVSLCWSLRLPSVSFCLPSCWSLRGVVLEHLIVLTRHELCAVLDVILPNVVLPPSHEGQGNGRVHPLVKGSEMSPHQNATSLPSNMASQRWFFFQQPPAIGLLGSSPSFGNLGHPSVSFGFPSCLPSCWSLCPPSFLSPFLPPFVSGRVPLLVGHRVRLVSLLFPFVSLLVCLPSVSFCLPSCWSLCPSCLPLSPVLFPFLVVIVSALSPFSFLLSPFLAPFLSLCPSCLPSVSFCLPSCWALCPSCLPSVSFCLPSC